MKPHFPSTRSVAINNSLISFIFCLCFALFGNNALAQVEFSVDFMSGCAPLSVIATNNSHTYWDTTNATFYWYDTSSNPTPTDSTYNFTHTYTTPGDYEMRLQAYDQFSVYQGEYNINITVGGAGSFTPADSSEFCPGTSLSFQYNNFYNNLEWDFGDGSGPSFSNWVPHSYADTGTYTVRLVVNDMCGNDTAYQTIQIYNTAVPVPSPSANVNQVCVGDQVSFNAGGLQSTYLWDFDDTDTVIVENPSHSFADTGDYMIVLTVTNSCGQQGVDSFNLRVDTGLFPNAWFNYMSPSCPNQMVNFSAGDPGSYAWDFGNGLTSTGQNPNTYYADTGTYTVRLILSNGCGYIDTNIQNITISYDSMGNMGSAQIEFAGDNMWQVDTDSVCVGDPVTFQNNSWSGSNLTYKWLWGDGDSSIIKDAGPHSYSSLGTYEVQLIRTTGCGGSDTARKWVVVTSTDSPSWAGMWMPMTMCPGETALFLDFDLGDDDFVYTYNVWYGDGDSSGALNAPSDPDLEFIIDTHLYANVGSYEVIFTATNGCGITDSIIDSIYVNDPNPMPMYFYGNSSNENGGGGGPSGQCPGDTVSFYLLASNDVVWDYGDGSPLDSSYTGLHTYASVGTYYVEGYVQTTCGTVDTILDTAYVIMSSPPGGGAGVNDNFGCIGDTMWFERTNWGGGGGGPDEVQNELFVWAFGDGDSAFIEEPYHIYENGGVYQISFTITNGCGSSTDNMLTVLIDEPIIDESGALITDASCGGTDGEVNGLDILSPGQFTFLWRNASESIVGSDTMLGSQPAGVYMLTVTNQNGCTSVSSPYAIVETGAPATPTAPSPADYCMGDVIADLTAVGGAGTLIWYSDAALTDSINNGSPFASGATTDTTFYVTEKDGFGCESPAQMVDITVNPTYLIADPAIAICDGDSVMIYGTYETVGATYYDTLTSLDLCDSIRSTALSVDPIATVSANVNDTTCEGSAYTLNGSIGGGASTSTWTTAGDGSFSDSSLLAAIYTPGSGDIGAGTVTLTLTTDDPAGPCGVVFDAMTLTINVIDSMGMGAIICDDDSVMLGGSYQNTAGTYIDVYIGTDLCDSVVSTTLIVNPTYLTPVSVTICSNDSVMLEGAYQNTSATYVDTLTSVSGCDSIISTALTVNAAASVSAGVDGANCEGPTPAPMAGTMGGGASSITWTTTGSGSFSDINLLTASYTASFADVTAGFVINIITTDDPDGAGPCVAAVDSMTLTLIALDSIGVGAIICDGDSIMLGGAYQTSAGNYMDTYLGSDVCDSIVTTTLVVNPTYAASASVTICDDDSVMLAGSYQNTAGTYVDSLTSVAGCDSIITTTLTVNPTYATAESAVICDGDSILLGGAFQTTAGTYVDTLSSIDGCDSIVTTTLTINLMYSMTPSTSICTGDSIFLGGAYQTGSGSYVDSYTSVDGCDSTVTTTLNVVTTITVSVNVSICDGDSVLAGGAYQTTSGAYLDSLVASGGCDSLVTTNVTVNAVYTIPASASICDNDSIMLGGAYQMVAGVYVDSYLTVDGCDSIINTTLTVMPTYNGTANMVICAGDSIMLGGAYQTAAGTYVDTYTASNSCDSVISTTLTVNPTSSSSATASLCSLDSIMLGGAYQNTSGTYYDTLSNANGCDSVITTVLTVYPVWTIDSVIVADVSGCGATDGTINAYASGDTLPVLYSIDGFSSSNTSGSFTGLSAGFYTVEIQDSIGCWSLFPVSSTVTISEPSSISIDSETSTDVTGCNGDNSGTIIITASGGTAPLQYSIDGGSTYQASGSFTGLVAGTYNVAVQDAGGTPCTGLGSAITITEPAPIGSSETAAICDVDSVLLGGAYQNTAGMYIDTLTSSGGCDSVVVTTLSINATHATASTAAICAGDSIMLAGAYQMTAGTYVDSMTAGGGCDSVVTTTLSVNAPSSSSATATICQGDSIMLGGAYQMTSGSYDDVYTGSNGCDSTLTTVLTVEAIPVISVSPSPGVVCAFGDTVMFTALGAATYSWSPSTGLDTTAGAMVSASPGSATTYTVTGTSAGGCVSSTTVDVQLSGAGAAANFMGDTTATCAGGSIAFTNTSTNATGYSWSFAGGTTADTTLQDPMVMYSTAGTYDVSLTAYGCGADSTITMSAYITVAAGALSTATATICSSDSIMLGGAYQNTAGVYSDTYVSVGGCDSVVLTTLSVDTAVSAGISSAADACGSDLTFVLASGLGGTPAGGGSWNDDDGSGALILFGTISPTFMATGTFNFTYTVSGGGACPDDSATVTLTIHPAPDAGTGNTLTSCLSATSVDITTGLGGTPDSGGVWVDESGSGALTGTIFDPSVAGLGSYNFSYSVPGNAGCPADTAIVTMSVVAVANAGTANSTSVCNDLGSTLDLNTVLGGTPDVGGTWSDDDGSGGFFGGSTFLINLAGPGTYNFTYTITVSGCADDSATVTVTVLDPPDAGSDGTLNVCDSETSVDVSTGLSGAGSGGTWIDNTGVGVAFSGGILDVTGLSNGPYSFTYTVTDPPCADASATVTVNLATCIGIGELDANVIRLYPNPSEGKFTLELGSTNNTVQIQVYNSTGELIAEYLNEGEANMEIDLMGNPNGLYYINVIDGDRVSTTKVSITR